MLEEINTALRLGDKFIPPPGSMVRVRFYHTVEIVGEGKVCDARYHASSGRVLIDIDLNIDGSRRKQKVSRSLSQYGVSWWLLEVTSVPDSVPPFEHWVRA